MSNSHTVFPHQRLRVYQSALQFAAWVREQERYLSMGSSLREQLRRASSSIVLNIAEGAAQSSRPMQRKHYSIALASAAECSAALDLAGLAGRGSAAEGQELLGGIGAMLRGLLR